MSGFFRRLSLALLLSLPALLSLAYAAGTVLVTPQVRADLLVCRKECIPPSGEFTLSLSGNVVMDGHRQSPSRHRSPAG